VAGNVQNLKPWPKGVSGNPGGRPRRKLISDELERLLEQEAPGSSGKTWACAIAETLLKQAAKGNVRAIVELANRLEGTPRQSVDVALSPSEYVRSLSDEEVAQRIAELTDEVHNLSRQQGH